MSNVCFLSLKYWDEFFVFSFIHLCNTISLFFVQHVRAKEEKINTEQTCHLLFVRTSTPSKQLNLAKTTKMVARKTLLNGNFQTQKIKHSTTKKCSKVCVGENRITKFDQILNLAMI